MATNETTPALLLQRTGRGCLAGSSGLSKLAQLSAGRQRHAWQLSLPNGETRMVNLTGRPEWLLAHLAETADGVTARDLPAGLRISGFVHLRRASGVPIETEFEMHGGPYSGVHARYRLACRADRVGGAA
jgi:hypothetical protein